MLANMASSLIKHKRIITTVAKAKALRTYVEPLITKGKDGSTHNRRTVFAYLKDKDAVKELFDVVGGKVAARPGGYTRILKTGNRPGDNAEMALIELVDFNELFEGFGKDKKSGSKRTRRGKKASGTATASVKKTAEAVSPAAEVVAAVEPVAEVVSAEETSAEIIENTASEVVETASAEETNTEETPSSDDQTEPKEEA